MADVSSSILLIGESGVGKTHYGAQLLRRLMKGDGSLYMDGAATNLEPFEAALNSLNEGRAAGHTARSIYIDSVWPVADKSGGQGNLVWPEYGGEQIKSIVDNRRLSEAWQTRIGAATAWVLLIRLQQTRIGDDIFSKPLAEIPSTPIENREVAQSDQARLVELLQMLIYAFRTTGPNRPIPRIGVFLTCWDEARIDGRPIEALTTRLPLVSACVRSNWKDPIVMGISALERPLSPTKSDMEYITQGAEHFGYIIRPDGIRSDDLTIPIHFLLT